MTLYIIENFGPFLMENFRILRKNVTLILLCLTQIYLKNTVSVLKRILIFFLNITNV